MSSPQFGVFPLGPAPDIQREVYRRGKIIENLVRGMLILRWQVSHRLTTPVGPLTYEQESAFWAGIHADAHGQCIICGKDRGDKSNDLDTLFCSFHCPVCSGWEAVLDVESA